MPGPGFSFSLDGLDRAIEALDTLSESMSNRVLKKLQAAADATYRGADATVPVDKGDLKASGRVEPGVGGDREQIFFDVTYGDGSSTETIYNYPPNDINGEMDADGYTWFVELGTQKAAAQPFLGPAFEEQSQKLLDKLGDILS